jgi:maltose alpha-D-glucosyltransferase / alpha-amylase
MERDNPLWFKNAVIYQTHVKAFFDSTNDGIGDFTGLYKKLDYIESLNITAIWLLPFYPSPLKDDGYDIADYHTVHPDYGTLSDFKRFLHAAHDRGLRVITELVINHTSDQHQWFQRARHAPSGSSWRNFYVWSDTADKYKEARIIFGDFESSNWSWDPVAKAYYWHRFYSHQPDLNYDNPLVQKQVFKILDYWLEMGVDGMRLDAIPYLYEREGTNCENLPETHEFLKKLRAHVDSAYSDRVLIAEANQWPEDAARYFGKGDECHMAFHFPIMPRLFMAINMEDRFAIIDILEQTPDLPENCQWVMFLRNHDELTLEMVTDRERDYMWRMYAKDPKARINLGIRRRLAPLLENNRQKIELMMMLLFSLPGTPVLYYGDEIGMGDNYYLGDRNGVRTPMQWTADRNAGFSTANPQQLYLPLVIDPLYHYEVTNVENNESNPSSLLWWIRRILAVRNSYKAFGQGSLTFITSENAKVLSFVRTYEETCILVVANLSRFSQAVELDLSKYSGYTPRELFHHNVFPIIHDSNYCITLGGHGYYLLSLEPSKKLSEEISEKKVPTINVQHKWEEVFKGKAKLKLERVALSSYLVRARWFERKSCTIQNVKIVNMLHIDKAVMCLVETSYLENEDTETYLIPLSYAIDHEASSLEENAPGSIIAHLQVGNKKGVLFDSTQNEKFHSALLQHIAQSKSIKTDKAYLVGVSRKGLKKELKNLHTEELTSRLFKVEQSNSSIVFDKKYILKMFRRLEEGLNPDVEMQAFLSEKTSFTDIARYNGHLIMCRAHGEPITLALLQDFVANEGSGWEYAKDTLSHYYENVLALKDKEEKLHCILEKSEEAYLLMQDLIGVRAQDAASLLGKKTAEMHIALSTQSQNPAFKPEAFNWLYQRALYQEMRSSARIAMRLVKNKLRGIEQHVQPLVTQILSCESDILQAYAQLIEKPYEARRIRIHGDYHLGQLLHTGKDFVIIDFEGEPLHPLTVRRGKRSNLQDVAGMLRSFHYAAYSALFFNSTTGSEHVSKLEPWADLWYEEISKRFLKKYFLALSEANSPLCPEDPAECMHLLGAFILDKAIYELSYELNLRPSWTPIACRGILHTLKHRITF